jgi:hypothetical protein
MAEYPLLEIEYLRSTAWQTWLPLDWSGLVWNDFVYFLIVTLIIRTLTDWVGHVWKGDWRRGRDSNWINLK